MQGSASAVFLWFANPRRCASFSHSCAYPLPLKMMRSWARKVSFTYSSAFSRASFNAQLLKASAKRFRLFATAVFSTVFASERFTFEPGIRNSNLLPVNANGLVRFLSEVSSKKFGITSTPRSISMRSTLLYSASDTKASTTLPSSSPK